MIAKRLLAIQKESSPPAPAATDVYYDYRSLILNMQGSAGSTTFTDSSPNNFAITPYGNAQLASDATFGTVASFDGSGDYLSIPSNAAFNFGTGDFTVEAWVYLPDNTGDYSLISGSANTNMDFRRVGTTLNFGRSYLAWDGVSSAVSLANKWSHVAVSRSGATLKIFFDGSQVYSGTNSTSYSVSNLQIGRTSSSYGYLNGLIGPLRISPWAVYKSNFTPSQDLLPVVQDSNHPNPYYNKVALQLKFDGTNGSTSFVDTGPNAFAVTPSGNAQITSASKYGSGAGAFDGNGDYLTTTSPDITGTWTIEFWWYPTVLSIQQTLIGFNSGSNGGINIWVTPQNKLMVDNGSVAQSAFPTGTFALNQWHHVAVVRNGSTTTGYINGIAAGSNSFSPIASTIITVGRYTASLPFNLNGSIDELEITPGVAKYKANFTPPVRGLSTIYNPYTTLPVSGAALWLDGADSSTLFTDAGVTPVNKSGDLVYQWSDKSGNNRHATQATSANRPTWVPPASGQNGFGALAINGSQWLGIADDVSLRISTGMTFFAVVKLSNWSSNTHQTILEKGPHANGLNYVFGKYNSPNAMKFTYNNGSFRDVIESTSFNGGTAVNTLAWRVNKSAATPSVDFRANGLLKSTVNDANNLSYPSTSTTGARVGINGSSSESMTGSLMELVLYPFEMTDANIAATESYLRTKWGTP